MYSIAAAGLFSSGPALMTAGITDLELVDTAAGVRLISTTRAGGGVMVLSTGAKMTLMDSDVLAASPALPGPGRLELMSLAGRQVLCVGGGLDDRAWGYELTGSGGLGAVVPLSGSPEGKITACAAVTLSKGSFVYHAIAGSGLVISRLGQGGSFTEVGHVSLSPEFGAQVSAMAVATVDGISVLLALSASGNAVQSYKIGPHGGLALAATLNAAGGFGVASPSAVEVVSVAGQTLALVAAAGSSSISVLSVAADGSLRLLDHVIDTLDTRFQGICALDTVEVEGRIFVIAGGGDGGLTLLQLMPDGRLLSVGQFGDAADEAVGPISAITARLVDGQIEIYAAGEGAGVFRFTVDPGSFASPLFGTQGEDRLIGGAVGDYLDGRDGDDRLEGGAGGDILRDGAGKDTLYGGTGADVFVLSADGASDLICDFEVGVDRIDLTAWGRVYSLEAMKINTNAYGVLLSFGTEYLTIRSSTMTPIPEWSLTVADFFGLWHLPHIPEPGRRILGSSLAEAQRGGTGDDVLVGSSGADRLFGGEGFDTVDYGRSRVGLRVDLQTQDARFGMAGGDQFDSVEALRGGRGRDHFYGDAADNVLAGNGGRDWLSGRDGDDLLDGGARADWLFGGVGADTLAGGKGRDSVGYGASQAGVVVDLAAGTGRGGLAEGDVLRRIECVVGSGFDDRLSGTGSADWFYGGGGRDLLAGQAGADLLSGGGGNDTLSGGQGDDGLRGGAGADEFRFTRGGATDRIDDFQLSDGDRLGLDAGLLPKSMDLAATLQSYGRVDGTDFLLEFPGGESVILRNAASLAEDISWIFWLS